VKEAITKAIETINALRPDGVKFNYPYDKTEVRPAQNFDLWFNYVVGLEKKPWLVKVINCTDNFYGYGDSPEEALAVFVAECDRRREIESMPAHIRWQLGM